MKSVTIDHILTQGHSTLNRIEHPKSDQFQSRVDGQAIKKGRLSRPFQMAPVFRPGWVTPPVWRRCPPGSAPLQGRSQWRAVCTLRQSGWTEDAAPPRTRSPARPIILVMALAVFRNTWGDDGCGGDSQPLHFDSVMHTGTNCRSLNPQSR